MYDVDLESKKNEVVSNLLSETDCQLLLAELDKLGVAAHTAIFSSGTTRGPMKGYLLSREALFNNARAVNERLRLTEQDLWGASLPHYHIGGLSVYYRARHLGHSPVNLRPWDPKTLVSQIESLGVTVLSLVPTQLHDLVTLSARPPAVLKTVLIGGDFLGRHLELAARRLGWPVVRTFGMSEVCSQLCTGVDPENYLIPLPIHTLMTTESGQLLVKSKSLFTYKIIRTDSRWIFTAAEDLKNADGFYPLPDLVELKDGKLLHQGRLDEGVKVSGHLIDLGELKEFLEGFLLQEKLWGEMELSTEPGTRASRVLLLHSTPKVPKKLIDDFQKLILPVRVKVRIHEDKFERTELGKFKHV